MTATATQTPERLEYLRGLAAKFPARDPKGRVLGFYIYRPIGGERVAGPFATRAEAVMLARKEQNTVICGYVLTDEDTVITESDLS